MNRRLTIWISMCLITGLLINVAVALICAWVAQQWPSGIVALNDQQKKQLAQRYWPGIRIVQYENAAQRQQQRQTSNSSSTLAIAPLMKAEYRAQWGYNERMIFCDIVDYDPKFKRADKTFVTEIESGWPAKSLGYREMNIPGYDELIAEYRRFDSRWDRARAGMELQEVIWPVSPVLIGFLVNTLFYAAMIGVFVMPFPLRRIIRLKRGLCPRCAYPIGVSERCTECGTPVPVRARR